MNTALSGVTGNPEDVGVSLSSRKVENTVVVSEPRDRRDRRADQRQVPGQREQGALARRHPVPRLAVQDHEEEAHQDEPARVPDAAHRALAGGPRARDDPQARGVLADAPRRASSSRTASRRRRTSAGAEAEARGHRRPRSTPAATRCAAQLVAHARSATPSTACARSRSRARRRAAARPRRRRPRGATPGLRRAGGRLPQRDGGGGARSPSWSTQATTAPSSPPRAAAPCSTRSASGPTTTCARPAEAAEAISGAFGLSPTVILEPVAEGEGDADGGPAVSAASLGGERLALRGLPAAQHAAHARAARRTRCAGAARPASG